MEIIRTPMGDPETAAAIGALMARFFHGVNVRMERIALANGTMIALLVADPSDGGPIRSADDGSRIELRWWERDNTLLGLGEGTTAIECWQRALHCARTGEIAAAGLTVWFDEIRREFKILHKGSRDNPRHRPDSADAPRVLLPTGLA
jgi:hypothetical protein